MSGGGDNKYCLLLVPIWPLLVVVFLGKLICSYMAARSHCKGHDSGELEDRIAKLASLARMWKLVSLNRIWSSSDSRVPRSSTIYITQGELDLDQALLISKWAEPCRLFFQTDSIKNRFHTLLQLSDPIDDVRDWTGQENLLISYDLFKKNPILLGYGHQLVTVSKVYEVRKLVRKVIWKMGEPMKYHLFIHITREKLLSEIATRFVNNTH